MSKESILNYLNIHSLELSNRDIDCDLEDIKVTYMQWWDDERPTFDFEGKVKVEAVDMESVDDFVIIKKSHVAELRRMIIRELKTDELSKEDYRDIVDSVSREIADKFDIKIRNYMKNRLVVEAYNKDIETPVPLSVGGGLAAARFNDILNNVINEVRHANSKTD